MKKSIVVALSCILMAAPLAASTAGRIRSGNKHFKKGEYEKALEKYREAEIAAPHSPEVHFNIGDALYKLENYDEATAAFNRALGSKDKTVQSRACYNLGNTAYRQQKYDEALAHYKKALDLNPDDRDAKHNIEYLLYRQPPPGEPKNGDDKKDKNGKEDKNKEQQSRGQQGKEQEQNEPAKDEQGMSKEDAQRILQYYNEADKNSARKRKMAVPRMPRVEEDW